MTENQELTAVTTANIIQLTSEILLTADGNGFKIPEKFENNPEALANEIGKVVQRKMTLGGAL